MPRIVSALALAVALTGLTGCGSTTPSSNADDSTTSAASSTGQSVPEQADGREQTTDASPSVAPPTDDAQVIALAVTAGDVSGETGRVVVELGSEVRVEVTADVSDEVHVHGYDLTVDTVPGRPVSLEFTADLPGVFEVELHDSRLQLTRLQVQ